MLKNFQNLLLKKIKARQKQEQNQHQNIINEYC